jgi:hypothetical protein
MTNAQIIEKMSAGLIRTIEHRMSDMGETYGQAMEAAKELSCAGSAVWEVVDKHFA